MKILPKIVNLLIVWFPIILTFSLADQHVIPFCNSTLDHLDTELCETIGDGFPYATKNFIFTFLFMILPTFIAVNIPVLFRIKVTYETFETLLLIILLVFKTSTSGLYYGFAVENGAKLELSSTIWLLSFLLAKVLSKLPNSDSGKVFQFWSSFLLLSSIYDPFLINVPFNVNKNHSSVAFILLILELAYAKWVERRDFPIPFVSLTIILFVFASICLLMDDTIQFMCDESSGFLLGACGRGLTAIAICSYFIGFRQQEKTSRQLVQNRFEEVSQRADDDQLI